MRTLAFQAALNVHQYTCSYTLLQPSKFAPHLEKCMGMGGRESKRVATKRSRQQAEDSRKVWCAPHTADLFSLFFK